MPVILGTQTGGRQRSQLVDQVREYGFNHLSDERLQFVVDQAVSEIDGESDWPYKEGVRTGSLPLVLEDLGALRRVVLSSGMGTLPVFEKRELEDDYGDLYTLSGTPQCAYVDGGQIVRSYPLSTVAVSCDYLSTTSWQSGGALAASDDDRPLMPARYQDAIVLMAASYCYGEDSQAESEQLHTRAMTRVEQMRWQLLSVNRDQPRVVREGFNSF
jgi:hypothetical protein